MLSFTTGSNVTDRSVYEDLFLTNNPDISSGMLSYHKYGTESVHFLRILWPSVFVQLY